TSPAPPRGFENYRVLLADDHPINRRVVQLVLEAAGVVVRCVENGAEALEALVEEPFDLVLMDMQMPVMDGLTAIRELRAREASAGKAPTPVYMLTGNAMPEHVNASFAAGADGHIAKPIVADELVDLVISVASGAAPDRSTGAN